ncbi:sensor histidine kinase [Rhizobium sp. XQZ8]|uniref:sensor histidine kinase n=1 Tax=Rhizobium populisoli TaxID=2859785 RepID=UPI001CA57BD7|nr:sensor histidine kinase [Rhizobium populisoli]MBW6424801.1 sensor histidine kinase [Rhizobium populisoli]
MSDIPTPDEPLWSRLLPNRPPSLPYSLALGLGCLAVGYGIRLLLSNWVTGAPFLTFFPLIVIASVWGGAAAGAVVLIGAAGLALAGMTATNNLPGLIVAVSMFLLSGALMTGVIHALQRALVRLRASEEQAEVMAREMRHRVANVLQLVQSIAQLSLRTSTDPSTVLPLFESRLMALSKSHRISSGGAGRAPTDLRALLTDLLAAYGCDRVDLYGPPLELDENLGPRIGLIIHELATNAAKHGALSVPEGRVAIAWEASQGVTELTWRETGGPLVLAPTRQGFGSKLIPAALPPDLGRAEIIYAPEGVSAYLRFRSSGPGG